MEIYLTILFLLALTLIFVRFYLGVYKPKDYSIKVANVQNLGDSEWQSNYFTVLPKRNSHLVCLADGIVDTKSGRLAAIIAVDTVKTTFVKEKFPTFLEFVKNSKMAIEKNLRENINTNSLNIHLTILKVEDYIIYYENMGNTVMVYRNTELIYLSGNSRFSLKPGDVIIVGSEGTMENLKEVYIRWYLGLTDLSLKEKSYMLLKKALSSQRSRNQTLIILEVPQRI